MSDHSKERGHHREHNSPAEENSRKWYHAPHRSWMFWVAVVLMLAGITTYLMTFDERVQPDGKVQQPMPAAGP